MPPKPDHILTSQEDSTAKVCGVISQCVEAFRSDQAVALKFETEDDAAAELEPVDVLVRGIFIIRWTADLPEDDREFVEWLLENAGKSGD